MPFLRFRDQRVDTTPHTLYFPQMHMTGILRWPFIVVEISEKAKSIEIEKASALFISQK